MVLFHGQTTRVSRHVPLHPTETLPRPHMAPYLPPFDDGGAHVVRRKPLVRRHDGSARTFELVDPRGFARVPCLGQRGCQFQASHLAQDMPHILTNSESSVSFFHSIHFVNEFFLTKVTIFYIDNFFHNPILQRLPLQME
jgi:hypothetical protein